jgi:hypothetical protein
MGAHSSNNRKAHAPRVPARRVWALLCVLVAALLAGAHGQVEPAEVAVQQDVVVLDAASPARAYLLNTTGSGAGGGQGAPPSARRPALAYAKPGGYEEAADDANLGEAMKLPAEKNGLKVCVFGRAHAQGCARIGPTPTPHNQHRPARHAGW